jgi:hypothetical protein
VDDERTTLQYDRRLARRRGWITPEQVKAQLDSLPDVEEKGEAVDSPFPPAADEEAESETAGSV